MLFDTTALAEFPLIIRLRNDADLRAGLKYISVEEHLRPGLPQLDEEEAEIHGAVSATRVFRRPRAEDDAEARDEAGAQDQTEVRDELVAPEGEAGVGGEVSGGASLPS